MKKIKVVTNNNRGFLLNLFSYKSDDYEFIYDGSTLYEISTNFREIISRIICSKPFDVLGLFRVIKTTIQEDVGFSYNRFLKTDKPYFIYLENPSALVNYSWDRSLYPIAKYRLKKCLNDSNLKRIICMSKACYRSIRSIYDIPNSLKIEQIYPLITEYNDKQLYKKAFNNTMECLFIGSQFVLKGGREVVSSISKLRERYDGIRLTIITRINEIPASDMQIIEKSNGIDVLEFNLSKKQLDEYYKKTAVLINPTRFDSFSLVTLEALKFGCSIVATDMYAIGEMVKENYNGFIHAPSYSVWGEDGRVKKEYRFKGDRKNNLSSTKIDQNIEAWLYEKISFLYENRDKLFEYEINSLNMANGEEFSARSISKKWATLIMDLN